MTLTAHHPAATALRQPFGLRKRPTASA